MGTIKFDEVKKVWQEIARHTSDNHFTYELEVHKKLLNIFHIGEYYYYIFNCATARIELVSEAVKQILGLDTAEAFSIEHLLSIIHPEDLPYFLDFENRVTRFFNGLPPEKVLKYKVSYDYRVKRQDGRYIRLLQQVVTIQSNEHGAVIRVLGIHTDITHLNKAPGSTLSFIGLEGEPSFHEVCTGQVTHGNPLKDQLSKREKQILSHLVRGETSKEISEALFISALTVDGHRKNILKKFFHVKVFI